MRCCQQRYQKLRKQNTQCAQLAIINKEIEEVKDSIAKRILSPEVALYLYKSIIRPCMEYCCHVWTGAPSCYLELLDKLQKRIRRTVGPSLADSLEPLAHRRNVASLSLFYRYYFGRCSPELAQLVPLPFSRGRSTRYSDRLHSFSVTIPKCYKDIYVNSFFPCTTRLGILCL